ncbi:hypothetical protein TSAR_007660 [Trichomalopsis sarcophagae]|uniref:Uncharacterized protein n=1 Tax=Trichomalopsis sarcophagae TaxID=543379 RepID=A0A232FE67_9HYME|nr:hypothetical protein TSAR_007660 [Trichomalopsis sarcophagae]
MIGKTSVMLSLLLLCVVFTPAQSDPLRKNAEDRPTTLNGQGRTFGFNWFGSRDWPQFRQIWRLPSFPTINGMSSFFEDEQLHENFHKRISDLENGQRRIVNYLRKLTADKNANGPSSSSSTSTQLPECLPTPVADSVDPPAVPTNATGIVPEPQTSTAASTMTTVETRPKDEKTEAATTIDYVTTESTTSANKFADKNVEAVTVPTKVSEESSKGADEETTIAPESYDSEETNELFV